MHMQLLIRRPARGRKPAPAVGHRGPRAVRPLLPVVACWGCTRSRRSLAGRTMVSAQYPRFRPILDQFAPYQPGKTPSAPDGRSYKLSSNESPFGPLPSVVKVIAEAAGRVNRYPDNGAVELIDAIAARFGVPASHV